MDGDGLLPVALLFVNAQQIAQRRDVPLSAVRELLKQTLGAIKESCAKIVLGEREHRVQAMHLVQRRPRHDVLVDSDRAVDLAAAPIEAAEREMRLHRLVVYVDHAQEHFQRLVRLLIEQEAQAAKVLFGEFVLLRSDSLDAPAASSERRQPAAAAATNSAAMRNSRRAQAASPPAAARACDFGKPQRATQRPRSLSSSATQYTRQKSPATTPHDERHDEREAERRCQPSKRELDVDAGRFIATISSVDAASRRRSERQEKEAGHD